MEGLSATVLSVAGAAPELSDPASGNVDSNAEPGRLLAGLQTALGRTPPRIGSRTHKASHLSLASWPSRQLESCLQLIKCDALLCTFARLLGMFFFFVFFFLGYREDVHSMQAARPTKIPDEPMLCETPALSR